MMDKGTPQTHPDSQWMEDKLRRMLEEREKRIAELERAYRDLEAGTDSVVIRRALRAEATIKRVEDELYLWEEKVQTPDACLTKISEALEKPE